MSGPEVEGVPAIGAVAEGVDRPFWSIMLPAYEPSSLLERALRAVLDQDEGAGRMQVAVVDDASPTVDVEGLVRRLAGDRVEYHRNPTNLRLAGCWNRAIGLARGRWVHLLHQDDLVLPGFYERLARADASGAGAAFCQHVVIDELDNWIELSPLERRTAGLVEGWLDRIGEFQRLHCPSIAVRREAYERVGGFHEGFRMLLDWEMWVRLATGHAAWYEPTVLACYRYHEGSESDRLRRSGADVPEYLRAIDFMKSYTGREDLRRRARSAFTWYLLARSDLLMESGDSRGALGLIKLAYRHNPGLWASKWLPRWARRSAGVAVRRRMGGGRG